MRFTARSEDTGPGGESSSPPVVIHMVTIEFPMRQAAVWPPVHSMQVPANLPGYGWAELGVHLARYELRGVLASFRPDRIAQPGQS